LASTFIERVCFKLWPRPSPSPEIEIQSFEVELKESLLC